MNLVEVAIDLGSAVLCCVLVKFMTKPYELTREISFLGLPLGFSFLGLSFALGAIFFLPTSFSEDLIWLPILTRSFAFAFISTSYFFSNRWSKKGHLLGGITVSLLVLALSIFVLLVFVAPAFALTSYSHGNVYFRVFNLACLSYIVIYTLRSHVRNPNSTKIWIPFGFIFLAISEYSLVLFYLDSSGAAFAGALITRLIGLSLFFIVAYRIFYSSNLSRG